mmetsp:Transcript_30135/g.96431  ORF Transcript_30135/g.96431 Transcript_30135/m.96431 type:complete len:277 (-) Transcript_30135:340-1170(-)
MPATTRSSLERQRRTRTSGCGCRSPCQQSLLAKATCTSPTRLASGSLSVASSTIACGSRRASRQSRCRSLSTRRGSSRRRRRVPRRPATGAALARRLHSAPGFAQSRPSATATASSPPSARRSTPRTQAATRRCGGPCGSASPPPTAPRRHRCLPRPSRPLSASCGAAAAHTSRRRHGSRAKRWAAPRSPSSTTRPSTRRGGTSPAPQPTRRAAARTGPTRRPSPLCSATSTCASSSSTRRHTLPTRPRRAGLSCRASCRRESARPTTRRRRGTLS